MSGICPNFNTYQLNSYKTIGAIFLINLSKQKHLYAKAEATLLQIKRLAFNKIIIPFF